MHNLKELRKNLDDIKKKLENRNIDFDKDFFSCSSFSFLLIKSLFSESFLLKFFVSKSVFRSFNFFL